ncbi:hypothetical protein IKD56_00095 [bacterium]|nr:hypothetical protein [bacterium]MBR2651794.1 hypothetical protein [bacterium]
MLENPTLKAYLINQIQSEIKAKDIDIVDSADAIINYALMDLFINLSNSNKEDFKNTLVSLYHEIIDYQLDKDNGMRMANFLNEAYEKVDGV